MGHQVHDAACYEKEKQRPTYYTETCFGVQQPDVLSLGSELLASWVLRGPYVFFNHGRCLERLQLGVKELTLWKGSYAPDKGMQVTHRLKRPERAEPHPG